MGMLAELDGQVRGRVIVAERLARTVRLSARLSQEDLARIVGCTGAAISYYESGKRRPSGPTGRRYLEAIAHLSAGERP